MSSNRYSSQNRYQGGGGGSSSSRPQQKFVPKKDVQTNQTLSNSLRQQQSKKSGGAASTAAGGSGSGGGSASRLRMSENGDWVSSGVHSGNFVNYLPQDEAVAAGLGADEGGLDPVESQRVVDLLNRELSRLLKLNPRDFWREVASDTSLHSFLESFLKFRSRWYDFPYRGAKGIVAGVIVGEFELSRRVFMTLYRISSNRDPGVKAADSLSQKDYSALLQEKKLLNLPKLLEISAIYGHENEDLTRILVMNAVNAQPWIHDDLTAVISHFLNIVQTMYQRCSSSLEVLFSSVGCQDLGPTRLLADYLEVMDFINDAVVSLDAFVNAYKQSAVYFSSPVEMSYGNEEMLTTLARLHDSLLPSLHRGFNIIFASKDNGSSDISSSMHSNVYLSLKMLATRIVNFGWKLLYFCYLSDEVFDGSFPIPVGMKMFPAKVEDPVIRTDIVVQLIRDVNGVSFSSPEGHTKGTLLQNIEENHKIMSRIELLRNAGWFSVDDDQLRFLSGIVVNPLKANITTSSMPSTGTDGKLQDDEDTAIIESKISQIKDLFPEYGKGFLVACLEVYNQDPEEVIQRILEGTLHKDLQSLDIALEETPKPKSVPSLTPNDKGKGKLLTPNDKGKGKLLESEPVPQISVHPAAVRHQADGSSNSSTSVVGRFIRKTDTDQPESLILNSRSEKDLARTAALVSQLEYEDEYDDSFDDLGMSIGDSALEETETQDDKLNSSRGKSLEADDRSYGANPSNATKWGSRKKPQFYVKDGKNYSYKVEGSVAVANYNEASLVTQSQRELIHGLGRGGNLPLGAVKKIAESAAAAAERGDEFSEDGSRGGRGNFRGRGRRGGHGFGRGYVSSNPDQGDETETNESGPGGRGNFRGRGQRGGHGFGRGYVSSSAAQKPTESSAEQDNETETNEESGPGGRGNSRGRGHRGGGRNHNRRDRSMKKHMSGVTGHW
nr:uncharacterized protein LOC109153195 [Ipomoea trifida]